jgi:hypothetical protein
VRGFVVSRATSKTAGSLNGLNVIFSKINLWFDLKTDYSIFILTIELNRLR